MTDEGGLGIRLEGFVAELVAHGRFKDRDSVLRESVLLLEERERKLLTLDAAIERGLADIAAGRVVPFDEALTRLEAKFGSLTAVDL